MKLGERARGSLRLRFAGFVGAAGLFALLAGVCPAPAGASPPWSRIEKLHDAHGAQGDQFGVAVALNGDIAVVGAASDDDFGSNAGSASMFQKIGGVWTQIAKLTPDVGAADDEFGSAVAFDGTTVVVGAYQDDDRGLDSGSAYVFRKVRGEWTQVAKFTASDGVAGDAFGFSLSVSGDTIFVGANEDDDQGSDSGSVYIFDRIAGVWSQTAKILASDGAAGDRFGHSVSIGVNRAVVGANADDDMGVDSGSVYIFERIGGVWSQSAKLVASDGAAGDFFGWSVSLSGDSLIAGAYRDGEFTGSAYIFRKVHLSWVQTAKLIAADSFVSDFFGFSVALSGDIAIVGAPGKDDFFSNAGSAYFFERVGGVWTQTAKLLAVDGSFAEFFGESVALSGVTALVGARFDDDLGDESGSATIFEKVGCRADFNGDAALDFFDVAAFLGAFASSDPSADCTGDGIFDFFDVLAFLSAFSAGCP